MKHNDRLIRGSKSKSPFEYPSVIIAIVAAILSLASAIVLHK